MGISSNSPLSSICKSTSSKDTEEKNRTMMSHWEWPELYLDALMFRVHQSSDVQNCSLGIKVCCTKQALLHTTEHLVRPFFPFSFSLLPPFIPLTLFLPIAASAPWSYLRISLASTFYPWLLPSLHFCLSPSKRFFTFLLHCLFIYSLTHFLFVLPIHSISLFPCNSCRVRLKWSLSSQTPNW